MDVQYDYEEWEFQRCLIHEDEECCNCGECCEDDDDVCVDNAKILIERKYE